jgi:hypothetical protein
VRGYGAAETVGHTAASLPDAVREAHPDGILVLLALVSDAGALADLPSLIRAGGTAVTTRYVADVEAPATARVAGVNPGADS